MQFHFGICWLILSTAFGIITGQTPESGDEETTYMTTVSDFTTITPTPPSGLPMSTSTPAPSGVITTITPAPPSGLPMRMSTPAPSGLSTTTTLAPPADLPMTTSPSSPSDSASTTNPITPPSTNGDNNEDISRNIQHILATSKIGYYIGNMEFDQQSTLLRVVGNLGPNSAGLKQHAYDKFVSYNLLRLKLEGDVDSRIAIIDNYFIFEKLSSACKAFYNNQKKELVQARNESNAVKAYKLKIYSGTCPSKDSKDSEDSESEEDSDYDNCFFWPFSSSDCLF